MRTRKWIPVLLPFAVGLLGSNLHWSLAGLSRPWGQIVASLYYLPIVIAAISLGVRQAVIVSLAAGAVHGAAAVLGSGESWIQAIAQTMLFLCVGLTASKLADQQRGAFLRHAVPKGSPSDSLENSFSEVQDDSEMSALGRVVVGLIRQFRTPVTSIEGAGWVLEDARLPEEKRQEFVGIVRRESHRLNRVLSDVLDFTRPRKPKLQSVDLSALVDEIIKLAGPKDHGPFFLFRKDIPLDFPRLRCDPDQFRQALLNLAMNAIQASPGGGQIEISARLEGGNAVIRFKDHGRGIPPAIVDRIFDPFFTTRENSLGLGLPVARRILNEHGGTIAVEQSSDRGTCVSVTLPISPARRP